MINNPRNVGILAFNEVEILDFAGPYEVFNLAGTVSDVPAFYVYSIGITNQPVSANGRLLITPTYSLSDCPQPDVLIIPGGFGTRHLLKHEKLIEWIVEQSEKVEWLLSVCTGALLLAKAGLLEDCPAVTHHDAYEHLLALSPTTTIMQNRRYVQSKAKVFTSGGISAGIDLSLHLVAKLAGTEAHAAVMEEMEYGWSELER